MRLVHFSDLHLDRPFAWAPRDVARRRRANLRQALRNIVRLADEQKADALCCGGDLFENDRISPDTVNFLRDLFAEIPSVRVFLAPGNHDWYGQQSPYHLTEWPANVHVFAEGALTPVDLEDGLTVWGAAHQGPATPRNLLDGFRVDRQSVNLGLFHASERGFMAFLQEGDKQPHAPFEATQIEQAGLDHAFLGHFHTPRSAERHTYPGNPDPLEFGETGERGAVVADVAPDGTVTREWVNVSVSRVYDAEVDVTNCASMDAVEQRINAALPSGGALRLTLRGDLDPDCEFNPHRIADVLTRFADGVLVRLDEVRVGYDLAQIGAEAGTVRAEFVRSVQNDGVLDEDTKRRVIVTGLRALEGRSDLEVW
jgi:exonuclease SbcD